MTVAYCLERARARRGGMSTLLVAASAETALAPAEVWRHWSRLDDWPSWSPLHRATRRQGEQGFAMGARFEQELELGFPVGRTTGLVTIDLFEAGRKAGWSSSESGFRSCHVWEFAERADGETLVSNVEVFAGPAVLVLRPFVATRWRHAFRTAVQRLVAEAAIGRRSISPPLADEDGD